VSALEIEKSYLKGQFSSESASRFPYAIAKLYEENGTDRYDQRKEYTAETISEGTWKIIAPPDRYRVSKNGKNLYLNGTSEALANKQVSIKFGCEHERLHERNISFFSQNWNKLIDIFYTSDISELNDMQHFSEVDLGNKYGRADFIGVGPDHLFIVEFGASRSGKSKQVNSHVNGVRSLAAKTSNISLSHERIVPFVVRYRTIDDMTTLDILPPNLQVKQLKESEDIFQHSPSP
jgi:hypothetical protein